MHEIVFHGNGGYDWHTLYNMPIWLRNFTFKKIQEYYKKQEEAQNKNSMILNQVMYITHQCLLKSRHFLYLCTINFILNGIPRRIR